jgi:hypothetical protein
MEIQSPIAMEIQSPNDPVHSIEQLQAFGLPLLALD